MSTTNQLNTKPYYRLNQLGIISISGSDAEKFLQGQLTCDVTQLNQSNFSYGAHCDPKGRIIFNFLLLKKLDGYLFLIPQSMISTTMSTLKKYMVFYRCTMQDISDNKTKLGVSEKDSTELNKYFTAEVNDNNPVNFIDQTIIIKFSKNSSRYILISDSEMLEQQLKNNFTLTDNNEWELQNIREGISKIYTETSGMFTPHEINLHQLGGVSFNKGCYTGQEIIARMQYLGKLKTQLFRIELNAEQRPLPGTTLFNEQKNIIGHIVTATEISPQHFSALAVLPNQLPANAIFLADNSASIINKFELTY